MCGTYINVSDLSKHLRTHGVQGSGDLVMPCAWDGCARTPMKRQSVVRHVEEVHLQVKYPCSQCGTSFSRKNTLKSHLSRLHSHIS
ncbi:hypothetical protein DFH29DRAFT_953521 [Suillus ampliporus]|nr:hypothetical protein DFH29DRAFT_953521 [Suillus ampliporus]